MNRTRSVRLVSQPVEEEEDLEVEEEEEETSDQEDIKNDTFISEEALPTDEEDEQPVQTQVGTVPTISQVQASISFKAIFRSSFDQSNTASRTKNAELTVQIDSLSTARSR
jgi:hypothetical protein